MYASYPIMVNTEREEVRTYEPTTIDKRPGSPFSIFLVSLDESRVVWRALFYTTGR